MEELIKNYKKKNSEDGSGDKSKMISKMSQQIEELKIENQELNLQVENLKSLSHHQPRDTQAKENNNSTIVEIHEKWILFTSEILNITKKLMVFTEGTIKTKNEKHQLDDFRKNVDSYESFLNMSIEDLQNLKFKNVN